MPTEWNLSKTLVALAFTQVLLSVARLVTWLCFLFVYLAQPYLDWKLERY